MVLCSLTFTVEVVQRPLRGHLGGLWAWAGLKGACITHPSMRRTFLDENAGEETFSVF